MIPAYDKVYLEKAQKALGRMLDYAVYDLRYDADKFFELFIVSGCADKFGAAVPVSEIVALYSPYHEMDVRQFCDKMTELYKAKHPEANLKRLRKAIGLTQSELAEQSEIPLRTIQQYEQRQKNINKAQAQYLIALSRVLSCSPEEIIEKV